MCEEVPDEELREEEDEEEAGPQVRGCPAGAFHSGNSHDKQGFEDTSDSRQHLQMIYTDTLCGNDVQFIEHLVPRS